MQIIEVASDVDQIIETVSGAIMVSAPDKSNHTRMEKQKMTSILKISVHLFLAAIALVPHMRRPPPRVRSSTATGTFLS